MSDNTLNNSVERFGYEQTLRRVLPISALVFYGLAFINPIGAFTLYGVTPANDARNVYPCFYDCSGLNDFYGVQLFSHGGGLSDCGIGIFLCSAFDPSLCRILCRLELYPGLYTGSHYQLPLVRLVSQQHVPDDPEMGHHFILCRSNTYHQCCGN